MRRSVRSRSFVVHALDNLGNCLLLRPKFAKLHNIEQSHEGGRETHGGVHIGFEMDELPDEASATVDALRSVYLPIC